MADGTVIQVESVQVDPHTGHVAIRVKTVTTETVNGSTQMRSGPTRSYGVDASAFQMRFGGQVVTLTAWIKSQHIAYQGVHEDLVTSLTQLTGTTI